MAEKDKLMDSEALEKVRELQVAAGRRSLLRYCDCFPILLAPFYFSPLSSGVSRK